MALEAFTWDELDQLIGSTFFLARLLNATHNFLDVTADPADAGLIEYINNGPTDLADELLPAALVLIREMHSRVVEVETAVAAAIESLDDRMQAEDASVQFDKITKGLY